MSYRSILETPVPQLLRTNNEPSDKELISVRRMVRDAVKEIETVVLDGEEARRHHAALAVFIHSHNAVISPIRRVPVEAWEEIFYHVAYGMNSEPLLGAIRRLRQVCRLWSIAAKSLPSPAPLVSLPPVQLTQRASKPSIGHISSIIPATGLLSIRMLDPIPDGRHPIVQLLHAHSQRWESLSISMNRAAIEPLGTCFDNRVHNLRRLTIHIPNTVNLDNISRLYAFSRAPMLTEVEVDCLSPLDLLLPWRQLKRYKERSRDKEIGLSKVFQFGANIEHLEYRTSDPGANVVFRPPRYQELPVVEQLRSIDIRLYHNSTTIDFPLLDQFSALSLRHIKMKDPSQNFLPNLLDYMYRCDPGSTLTSLIIHTSVIKDGVLADILMWTPRLMKLECNDIPLFDLRKLSVAQETLTLVPHLHDLVIQSTSLLHYDLDTLLEIRTQMSGYHPGSTNDDTRSPSQSELDQPFSVKLIFPDYRLCRHAMEIFMGPKDKFQSSRSRLSDILAELDVQVDEIKATANRKEKPESQIRGIWRSISSDQGPGGKLNDTMTYLEKIPLEKMPEVFHWAIYVLDRFCGLDPSIIPQDTKYNFLNRSRSLVYAWMDLCNRHMHNLTSDWILHGRFCLMYIGGVKASNSPRAHNWWDWMYDKYCIKEDRDVLWAHYDFSENVPISEYLSWRRHINFN